MCSMSGEESAMAAGGGGINIRLTTKADHERSSMTKGGDVEVAKTDLSLVGDSEPSLRREMQVAR